MKVRDQNLDPRAWLAWATAASAPALLGRNPWPLAATLLAVCAVRMAWAHRAADGRSWTIYARIALAFAAISIVFNVLTVRAGDRVIAELPESLPIVGGELSVNAAVYGALSGLALLLLVLVGSTLATLLDWSAIVRLMPPSLTNIAVAGSIAFTFLPQTAIAYGEIREAQLARGHRVRGARDLLPIIVPMIGGGLERAITLAEALESRGFGAKSGVQTTGSWRRYVLALSLAGATIAVYLSVSGRSVAGLLILAGSGFSVLVASRGAGADRVRTRYRQLRLTPNDTIVLVCSALALVATLLSLEMRPESVRYEPYPHLDLPNVNLPLLLALLLLLAPAIVAPAGERS
jgi:energy-coupling factor transport system permease protein